MPLFHKDGRLSLFVHVPKTGGTSVERHLEASGDLLFRNRGRIARFPCNLQHLHAAALQRIMAFDALSWSGLIVRHPVERIISEYRYRLRKPHPIRSRTPFSVWLRYSLARRRLDPWYRDNHFRPQHEFEPPSAEVLRFEDGVGACIGRISDAVGVPPPAEPIWETRSPPLEVRVSADDLDLIHRAYRADFDRYGYASAASSRDRVSGG